MCRLLLAVSISAVLVISLSPSVAAGPIRGGATAMALLGQWESYASASHPMSFDGLMAANDKVMPSNYQAQCGDWVGYSANWAHAAVVWSKDRPGLSVGIKVQGEADIGSVGGGGITLSHKDWSPFSSSSHRGVLSVSPKCWSESASIRSIKITYVNNSSGEPAHTPFTAKIRWEQKHFDDSETYTMEHKEHAKYYSRNNRTAERTEWIDIIDVTNNNAEVQQIQIVSEGFQECVILDVRFYII